MYSNAYIDFNTNLLMPYNTDLSYRTDEKIYYLELNFSMILKFNGMFLLSA